LKRLVLGALRLLARARPRFAYAVAHALVVLTRPFGFGIEDGVLAATFPGLSPGERRAARRRSWEHYLKGEVLEAAMAARGDASPYPRVVPNPALDALRLPVVLVGFHVGPYQALAAVLSARPSDGLAVERGGRFGVREHFELIRGGNDEAERARTFRRALERVRSGGWFFANLDALDPDERWPVATIDAPLLGGVMRLARGPFAVARLSGAPIVPLAARWRGTAIEVEVGAPVQPGIGEEGMARAVAAWLDAYLRERPGEVSVYLLARVAAPASR
jgi:lauroyl/myristoyl acyltransferase